MESRENKPQLGNSFDTEVFLNRIQSIFYMRFSRIKTNGQSLHAEDDHYRYLNNQARGSRDGTRKERSLFEKYGTNKREE